MGVRRQLCTRHWESEDRLTPKNLFTGQTEHLFPQQQTADFHSGTFAVPESPDASQNQSGGKT